MGTSFENFGPLMVTQLREQVGNLMAATQLLTPLLQGAHDKKYDSYLAITNQSLYRLLRLTANIELVTMPQEGDPPRMAPLDLAHLCDEFCPQVADLAHLANRSFAYHSEISTLLTTGDGTLLRRLLLNLISNALRAAGDGGTVGMRLTAGKEQVLITIWDSGEGMDFHPDTDPLFPHVDGIGLGLEVARQIAFLHGGTLLFDQQEGKGGRVTLSLPVQKPAPSASLHSPYDSTGGFSPVMVELSTILPSSAFLHADLE